MSKTSKWVLAILGAFIFFFGLFLLTIFSWLFSEPADETVSTSGERIAIIELKEPIFTSEDIVRQFKKYRDNKGIKAILFRVESPGGGVAASQEIYEEVKKTRDSGKPVVVSMGSVAASGGYYVSCGADRIVANPGTLTGSIGVIFQYLNFKDLMDKVGVGETTIKSGTLKDVGSPFRKSTEEEKRYLSLVIGDVYHQFVDVVAHERKLSLAHVKRYADGRIFTGRQAVEYGFVDTLGTYEDALDIAGNLAGIKGKPKTVKETKRRSFVERLLGGTVLDVQALRDTYQRQPVLQYRYTSPY